MSERFAFWVAACTMLIGLVGEFAGDIHRGDVLSALLELAAIVTCLLALGGAS